MRAFLYLVIVGVLLQPATRAAAGDIGGYYLGFDYTYQRAESYSSVLGGRVQLLQPKGFDYFKLDWVPWAVLIEGEISIETTATVSRLLKANPRVRVVYLNSPGGDLYAGMVLGALLHAQGLAAVVNVGAECESACALAFLGGSRRLLFGDNGRFGFHRQYYIVKGEIFYGSWAKDIAVIQKYLDGIDAHALSAEEIVGTTELITYSNARLKERGLVNATKSEVWDDESREVSQDKSVFEVYLTMCRLTKQWGFDHQCHIDPDSVVPLREPMLLVWFALNPVSPDEEKNERLVADTAQFFDEQVFTESNGFGGTGMDDINIECRKNPAPFLAMLNQRATTIGSRVSDASPYVKIRDDLAYWCNRFADERKSRSSDHPPGAPSAPQ